jgi:hypothetical protein
MMQFSRVRDMKAETMLNEIDQTVEDIRTSLQELYIIVDLACEDGIIADHDFSAIYHELEEIEKLIEAYL